MSNYLCLRLVVCSAIHAAEFLTDGYRIITCSDDQNSILWDLASGHSLHTYNEHKVCYLVRQQRLAH